MTSRYELVRPSEAPTDAVVVTIRKVHGQLMGEVVCTHCPAAEEYAVADFPRPILVALERAEELREICNLERVMIALAPGAKWNSGWGELVEPRLPRGRVTGALSGRRSQPTPPARAH